MNLKLIITARWYVLLCYILAKNNLSMLDIVGEWAQQKLGSALSYSFLCFSFMLKKPVWWKRHQQSNGYDCNFVENVTNPTDDSSICIQSLLSKEHIWQMNHLLDAYSRYRFKNLHEKNFYSLCLGSFRTLRNNADNCIIIGPTQRWKFIEIIYRR